MFPTTKMGTSSLSVQVGSCCQNNFHEDHMGNKPSAKTILQLHVDCLTKTLPLVCLKE